MAIQQITLPTVYVDRGEEVQVLALTWEGWWEFERTYAPRDTDLARLLCRRVNERGQIDTKYWAPGEPSYAPT